MEGNILVIGASGAIGRNLVPLLQARYGIGKVYQGYNSNVPEGLNVKVEVTNKDALREIVHEYDIGSIYHFAAMLSQAAEKDPEGAKNLNDKGLQYVLDVMKEQVDKGKKMTGFWASSMGVYGPGSGREEVAEDAFLDPTSTYGQGKVAGERVIKDFYDQTGVDMRIIRFPGLNGPGRHGKGTTEYAIDMIQAAARGNNYVAPLRPDTQMPMMDMRDAVQGIMKLMSATGDKVKITFPYNIAAFSFSPEELTEVVRGFNPNFRVNYESDATMQKTADSWPDTLSHSKAQEHWGWESKFDLREMVRNIFKDAKSEK